MTLREEILKESGIKDDKINVMYKVFNDDLGYVMTQSGKRALFPTIQKALAITLKMCKEYYKDSDFGSENVEFKFKFSNENEKVYDIYIDGKDIYTSIYVSTIDTKLKESNLDQKFIFEIER